MYWVVVVRKDGHGRLIYFMLTSLDGFNADGEYS